jgi:hypothetical protein
MQHTFGILCYPHGDLSAQNHGLMKIVCSKKSIKKTITITNALFELP